MNKSNKTKIIITLGPSSSNLSTLTRILKAGVDAIRLNASHEPRTTFGSKISLIRKAAQKANKPVCILLDLAGPKIRTGTLIHNTPVLLLRDQEITLTPKKIHGTCGEISVSIPNLSKLVKKGDPILIDDGRLELRVLSTKKGDVLCHVVVGGLLHERKGVNLPGLKVSIQSFTAKDRLDLAEGLRHGINAVALSFVQSEKSILKVKRYLRSKKALIPVIAKIEKPQAVENFDNILKESSAVMIARGDLGIEIPAEKVPVIQKKLIQKANALGKPIITATQMLESMIENPRPTRAESSDVANAVWDGTDAVMLSGETAVGKHPVQVCKVMSSIIIEAESEKLFQETRNPEFTGLSPTHSIAYASSQLSYDLKADSIVVFTKKGKSAILLSKFRPKAKIVALTPNKKLIPSLTLLWGVSPYFLGNVRTFDQMLKKSKKLLREKKILRQGQKVVFMSASPDFKSSQNWIKLDQV